jgi:cyclic beta-1,2-glucan synthetase
VARLGAEGGCDRALLAETATQLGAIDAHVLAALRGNDGVDHDPPLLRELRLWIDRVTQQLLQARYELDRLLPAGLGDEGLAIDRIAEACERAGATARDAAEQAALARARTEASDLCARLRSLATRARALAERMDFAFLYDEERRLLHVGFDVDAAHLDPHHYDLLASEARLASYVAIVWRQVPLQHWFALGRPVARAGRRGPMLLSWGGSMFEYLMPSLLMRSHRDTLLHQSCDAAVERQIAYGRDNGAPWGVSESGYAFLDGQQAYQYRSFGVPGLGMRRGLEEDLVVAPYASMLALAHRPRAVMANLAALERLGMLGRFGFYEAADFPARRAPGGRPALVL